LRNWSGVVAQTELLLTGKRCLVLDDEFLIALDIQQILEDAGSAEVACLTCTADALAALRDAPKFDVAILDVRLGGATCVDVAVVLAAQGIPFIFLTGARGDDEHIRQFPGASVVTKPYHVPALLDALRRALTSR
jgi:CheY-like chemotaxis protein